MTSGLREGRRIADMLRGRISGNKGLTLVEVMVAVTLATLIITAVLVTITRASFFSVTVDKAYTASNLARKRIELLQKFNFEDIANAGTETDVVVDADGIADASGDYIRTTEITETYDSNPYLLKIKVSVDRLEEGVPSGNPVIMTTLISDTITN